MTGFIVVLALAMAAAAILDLASGWPILVAMVALLIFDVAVLVLSDEMLTCYRCRSGYRGLAIARYHRPWNRRTAAKCHRT
jgi:membrane protein implicated in regulation of membrane protease activity